MRTADPRLTPPIGPLIATVRSGTLAVVVQDPPTVYVVLVAR